MKKLLYTTSALVGAAFLMEAVVPAKAEVNVSMRYRAALISQGDADGDAAYDLEREKKKHRSTSLNSAKIDFDFNASKDHPNGLTTSAVLKADTDKGGTLTYDDAYGSISGSFGKVDIGDMQDVGYRTLGYGTPGTGNFGAVDAGFQPGGTAINTSATGNITGRASTIAYWSPSFSGAQVGVSWQPQQKRGKEASRFTANKDVEDAVAFVASYSNSFGGTGVNFGVSYETAKVRGKAGAYGWEAADLEPKDRDDLSGSITQTLPNPKATVTDGVLSKMLKVDDDGGIDTDHKLFGRAGEIRDDILFFENIGDGGIALASGEPAKVSIARKNQDPNAFAGYVSFDVGQFSFGGSYGAWDHAAADSNTTADSTAYALGASYSVDAMTFGFGWAKQETDTTWHNIRSVSSANDVTTADALNKSTAYKRTTKKSILSFTTNYQLGDGAAVDFVIERGEVEEPVILTNHSSIAATRRGKEDVLTSKATGFGIGIDLKF